MYAVGVAAAVEVPWQTPTPVASPRPASRPSSRPHVAALNIAAQVRGEEPQEHKAFGDIPAVCVMDAGNNGVVILADKMLPPRKHGVLIPGPQAHLMKLGSRSTSCGRCSTGRCACPDKDDHARSRTRAPGGTAVRPVGPGGRP